MTELSECRHILAVRLGELDDGRIVYNCVNEKCSLMVTEYKGRDKYKKTSRKFGEYELYRREVE